MPVRAWHRVRHLLRPNTRAGARRNIHDHYDLGNDFYGLWLDPTMTYSSAIFAEPQQRLPTAQMAKYQRMAESLDLMPGHKVLEIGCGWGGFAEFTAASYGCHVTGITLSEEQKRFADQRVGACGPAGPGRDRVDRLPRRHRQLRPHRLDRDVRGGGRGALARLFRQGARPARAWRLGRPASDPDRRRALRSLSAQRGLHPALCLSRRHAAIARCLLARGRGGAVEGRRNLPLRPRLCAHLVAVAKAVPTGLAAGRGPWLRCAVQAAVGILPRLLRRRLPRRQHRRCAGPD